jgi:predicted nucleic acid-binding protein
MTRFLPDTSVMVAAVCSWHESHDAATAELERRFARGDALIVAAPALVETYAVLTRLPPPHRLSPIDAMTLLDSNFLTGSTLTALDVKTYTTLLRNASGKGIAGGRVYDWVIAACAVKANVSVLMTFNAKDFMPLLPEQVEIQVPGDDRR